MLNKLLSKVLTILPLNLICQIDTNSINKKYEMNNLKIFLEVVLKDSLINVSFCKTDTINGYELNYHYFIENDPNRCTDIIFFTKSDISKFDNMIELFRNTLVSFQSPLVWYSPVDFIRKGDTFSYRKNQIQYELDVFRYVKNNSLYKISNNEYLKLYKVKVIADVYEGDTVSLKMFNPLLNINNKSYQTRNVIFYQYRRVLKRKAYKPREILGMRRIKNKLYNQCIFSTW
jgi:hypothetical protein